MTITLKYAGDTGIEKKKINIDIVPYGAIKQAEKIEQLQKKLESKPKEDYGKDIAEDETALAYLDDVVNVLVRIFKLNGYGYDAEFFEDRVDMTDLIWMFWQCVGKSAGDVEGVKKKLAESATKNT